MLNTEQGTRSTARLHAEVIRGPLQMTLDITNRCNLRCLHCFNRSGENFLIDEELSDEEIEQFFHDVVTIRPLNICFCGGEPLLRREIVTRGIEILHRGGVMVSMVTNGLLMTTEVAVRLKEAGIYQVQVSVDGSTAESHDRLRGVPGAFDKAIAAIEHLIAAGVKTGVAFSPTRWNVDELPALVERLRAMGAKEVRCQQLMLLGRTGKQENAITPSPAQYRRLVACIRSLQSTCCSDGTFQVTWGDPIDHFIRFGTIIDACCPFVSVKANGAITPSIYLPLTVGSIRRHRLSEYWDRGLAQMWRLPRVKELSTRIRSVAEMDLGDQHTPTPYLDRDIELDFIDDKLYLEVGQS